VFRADQVGSFLRPPELLRARTESLPPDELRQIEDTAILTLLEQQRATGIDIFTDGELRRPNFLADFTSAVDGFSEIGGGGVLFKGDAAPRTTLAVTSRLQQKRRIAHAEAAFMRQHSPGPFKITLPTAFQFVNYVDGISDRVYPTRAELLAELGEIVAGEVRALIDDGVKYIQIDAPRYSYFIDPKLAAQFKAGSADPGLDFGAVIAADNLSLGIPRPNDVVTAIHLCRGNNRSTWYAEGGYDAIAERMFTELQADCFLLEYDDARSGSFEPLRFVPPGKVVVLGLVTSKFDALESQDELLRRIDAAARYVPLEQLALSPQCGFASLISGNAIEPETQWRKLELVADTARRVWG
jgi:methionine synthase II (cobalamin-independent)